MLPHVVRSFAFAMTLFWASFVAVQANPVATFTFVNDASYTLVAADVIVMVNTTSTSVVVYYPDCSLPENQGVYFNVVDSTCNSQYNVIYLTPYGNDNLLGGGPGVVFPITSNCASLNVFCYDTNWFGTIGY
jgi:hypothetical protein